MYSPGKPSQGVRHFTLLVDPKPAMPNGRDALSGVSVALLHQYFRLLPSVSSVKKCNRM